MQRGVSLSTLFLCLSEQDQRLLKRQHLLAVIARHIAAGGQIIVVARPLGIGDDAAALFSPSIPALEKGLIIEWH